MLFDEFQLLGEVSSTRVDLHEKRAKRILTIDKLVVTVFRLIFNHRYITHQYDVVELLLDRTEPYWERVVNNCAELESKKTAPFVRFL